MPVCYVRFIRRAAASANHPWNKLHHHKYLTVILLIARILMVIFAVKRDKSFLLLYRVCKQIILCF